MFDHSKTANQLQSYHCADWEMMLSLLTDSFHWIWSTLGLELSAHMFWWLYYTDPAVSMQSNRPLYMWLQGGPGSSGTGFGNFDEFGPLDGNLQPRNTTWVHLPFTSEIIFLYPPSVPSDNSSCNGVIFFSWTTLWGQVSLTWRTTLPTRPTLWRSHRIFSLCFRQAKDFLIHAHKIKLIFIRNGSATTQCSKSDRSTSSLRATAERWPRISPLFCIRYEIL